MRLESEEIIYLRNTLCRMCQAEDESSFEEVENAANKDYSEKYLGTCRRVGDVHDCRPQALLDKVEADCGCGHISSE